MALHHPILKARKAIVSSSSRIRTSGILETDFPVSKEEAKGLEESTFVDATVQIDCSGLSLNNYLSMMADEDVRSVQSLESGSSAMPKATSSVLFSPPRNTRNKKSQAANDAREAQLERWAKMLEEKELELTHKERRLKLWEAELIELQKLQLLEAQLAELQVRVIFLIHPVVFY